LRLSFNEIRTRAAQFAESYADAHYEKGETQTFYNDFFAIFGVERRSVARYEEHVKKLNDRSGFIDLFWPKVLLVEQKSAGRDLAKAGTQAGEYFDALKESERPRFQLLCDFQTFQLLDRDTREETKFALADLPKHVEKFGFIMGMEKRSFKDQDPVNIKAAELVGHLHDALEAGGYKGHQLEVFLTRLVFCLFADDTGIFEPRDIFLDFLETRTNTDGTDIGPLLTQLFEVLDTPENKRQTNLDDDLARFPYVNGGLFLDPIRTPAFNSDMRERLIEAARFNWSGISPAIFGSLFQSVMNKDERRKAGAHYTTEKNIMKVIGPLFLDDLRAEFETIRVRKTGRKKLLQTFHDKLSKLTFMDPACGCGNFLIITYRELRLLEIDLLRELNPKKQLNLDAQTLSRIDVDQFYGIEYEEFPARIAETAMWMMDHIMNAQLSLVFGQVFLRIPLRKSPSITHGDALEVDWETLLPAKRCSYVLGNPPFVGKEQQTATQKSGLKHTLKPEGFKVGSLDYVSGWFVKSCAYLSDNPQASIAFVTTNSICQGEQVNLLWPRLFDKSKRKISFAHRTFEWGSDAKGKAHVHCVIIGLQHESIASRTVTLFNYDALSSEPDALKTSAISPYLIDGSSLTNPELTIRKARKPLSERTAVMYGSKPCDDGNLIISKDEKAALLSATPDFADYVKPLLGSKDSINGEYRYCLWLVGASPTLLKSSAFVLDRIKKVKEFRLKSTKPATREDALTPTIFQEIRHTQGPFILIPRHSISRRDYIPISIWNNGEVTHDSAFMMMDWTPYDFSLLTSSMFVAWQDHVGGRIKSDWRFSSDLVYNTFPMPPVKGLKKLEPFAQAILDARAEFPDATLADLYDPDTMPANLRKAHIANDKAVDKLYRKSGFKSERERVEHLFGLYEKMTSGMLATTKKPRKRKAAVKP
jgi:hypothetical protein